MVTTSVDKQSNVANGSNNTSPTPSPTATTTPVKQGTEQNTDREHNRDIKSHHHDLEAGRTEVNHSSSTSLSHEDDEDDDDDDDDDDASSSHSNQNHGRRSSISATVVSRISTHISMGGGPDNGLEHYTSFIEVPDAVYDRIPNHRKLVIVALLSYCAFLAPISSTTVLSATPEVAADFHTTGSIVNVTNALYMLFMGVSPIFWGPFSEVWGRRTITCTTAFLFTACSIGTALSPNLAAFFVFRILTAFQGTAFLLVGSACIQDIYRPTERATAMGWFMSGTLIGPAIGPFIGGIIVTFTSWRVLFWVQTGLGGLATLGTFFLLPETIHHRKYDDLEGLNMKKKATVLCSMVNPWKVLCLIFAYPNFILVGLACSSLVWNMYSLLTPIRYVINPRFHLDSPMQSGLFYLAPGAGYVIGTFFGGRYADYVVKKHIAKSPTNTRIPEDRLRSALPFMGIIIPGCVLIYGWGVDQDVGGIPLVVVMLFIQGVAQLFCFPSLNTYCLDVMQGRGSDVIAGSYFLRYLFACLGSGVVLPAVDTIGVGWFSTISAGFLMISALGTWATVIWGQGWREKVDGQKRTRRNEAKKGTVSRKNGQVVSDGAVSARNEMDMETGRGEEETTETVDRDEHTVSEKSRMAESTQDAKVILSGASRPGSERNGGEKC